MRLPCKVTPFNASIFCLFPIILEELKKGEVSPLELYKTVRKESGDVSNFLLALDCLFILNKININTHTESVYYVD